MKEKVLSIYTGVLNNSFLGKSFTLGIKSVIVYFKYKTHFEIIMIKL